MDPCYQSCPPAACSQVFDRVYVWPHIQAGKTLVEWTLNPAFNAPAPYTFQLQVGRTGSNESNDWVNVGGTTNGYSMTDSVRRVYGKFQWTHYRVLLTDDDGNEYYSAPQHCLGVLSFNDWNKAKDIMRMEKLRLVQEAGQEGYLLKRKLFGELCTCVDSQTREILNAQHVPCYGTGFVGGYHPALDCVWVETSTVAHRSELDSGVLRGTINDMPRVSGRMLAIPQVYSMDVWVDKDTDFRWMIHSVRNIVEVRGVPLVVNAEMRLLPFTHPVYAFEIPGQQTRIVTAVPDTVSVDVKAKHPTVHISSVTRTMPVVTVDITVTEPTVS